MDAGLTVGSVRLLAETEGILTETAGGVKIAALGRAIEVGTVGRDDAVVVVITGNGHKTRDVLAEGADPLPGPIAPTFEAFEAWWGTQADGAGGWLGDDRMSGRPGRGRAWRLPGPGAEPEFLQLGLAARGGPIDGEHLDRTGVGV